MKKEITIVDVQTHFLKGSGFDNTYIISKIKNYLEKNISSIQKVNIVVDTLFEGEDDDSIYENIEDIKSYLIDTKFETIYEKIHKLENEFNIEISDYNDSQELLEEIEELLEDENNNFSYFGYEEEEYKDMINSLDEFLEIEQELQAEAESIHQDLENYLHNSIPFELAFFYYRLENEFDININIEIEKEYNYYRTVLDYYNNDYDKSNKLEKFPFYLKSKQEIEDFENQDLPTLLSKNKIFKRILKQYKEQYSDETIPEILASLKEMKNEVYESSACDTGYAFLNPDLEQVFMGGGANECLLEESICFCVNNPNININFENSCVYGEGDINSRYEDFASVFQNINIADKTKVINNIQYNK